MGFEKEEDFIGDVSVKNIQYSMEVLFAEVRKLRVRLGEHAYLLDRYLTSLMETMDKVPAYDAASDGFEAISELRSGFAGNLNPIFWKSLTPSNFGSCASSSVKSLAEWRRWSTLISCSGRTSRWPFR